MGLILVRSCRRRRVCVVQSQKKSCSTYITGTDMEYIKCVRWRDVSSFTAVACGLPTLLQPLSQPGKLC